MQNVRSYGMRLFEAVLWIASFIVMVAFAYMIVGEFLPVSDQQQPEPCLADASPTVKPKPC
jgi:uncharacterized membrane protein